MLKYHFFRLRSILFHLFFVPLSVFSEAQNGLERKEMPLNAIFRFSQAGGETPCGRQNPDGSGR